MFQARALYSEIYNNLTIFNDDSCMDADTKYIAARHNPNPSIKPAKSDVQKYSLMPNPNNGNIILRQLIPD